MNGTSVALSPSYPTVTGNRSIAIFDVYVIRLSSSSALSHCSVGALQEYMGHGQMYVVRAFGPQIFTVDDYKVSKLFSTFTSARLVNEAGKFSRAPIKIFNYIIVVGQWAVPCDSAITLSFTFG